MYQLIQLTTNTALVKNSINRWPLWRAFALIPVVLAVFALSRTVEASLGPDDTAYGTNALFHEAGGNQNSAFGVNALFGNTTGNYNTAVGFDALFDNNGANNTAVGSYALSNNTTGASNTAIGGEALMDNQTGYSNTAVGFEALWSNTSGVYNTAIGLQALSNNNGGYNTAIGLQALYQNSTGNDNTANGFQALWNNTSGSFNTATGLQALYTNNGSDNTANGFGALVHNTSGNYNTADGFEALYSNTTGAYNTAMGVNALLNTTGSSNVGLGTNAGKSLTTGSGNVCIGVNVLGVAGESNTTRVRNIYGSVATGRAVYVNSDNKIGTLASSRRFKEQIKPMDRASDAILALKPVTFRYKKEIDGAGVKQFGLVAEDVERVNPDLVTRDEEGKPETVRYDAINAMVLNEFLKEHRTVQEQKATIAELEHNFAKQQKQIEALTAGLQRVSAQLELSKTAPQTVVNDQ